MSPRAKAKRATRLELLNLLRNLYGDLTSMTKDGGMVLAGAGPLVVVLHKASLTLHLRSVAAVMDLEDKTRSPF